jgi:hypothetical protein
MSWGIIPPEIKHDEFYNLILSIVKQNEIQTILEIGASSGDGSTEAFVLGKQGKPTKLFSIEVCKERYDVLKQRYADDPYFFPYNVSSVPLSVFPEKQEIAHFMQTCPTSTLAHWPIPTVMEWYDKDVQYIQDHPTMVQSGIDQIKKDHGIHRFDLVLIDGSEFTGKPELDAVYGAKFILLDDINAYKNWTNHRRLCHDPMYRLLVENNYLRNGFSIFVRNI